MIAVMEDVDSWSELSAQELIEKRDSIEAEIKAQNDILEGVSGTPPCTCNSILMIKGGVFISDISFDLYTLL